MVTAMRTCPICIALLVAASAASAQTAATRVVGRVTGPDGREPLSGVAVRLGDRTVPTDQRGLFVIAPVEPGRHVLQFELIGYGPRADTVEVPDGRTTDVQVRLYTKAVELAPVTVTVRSRWLEQNGFFERRESGFSGKFITLADIEKKHPSKLTDLFQGMSGVKVVRHPQYQQLYFVRMNHAATDGLPALAARVLPGCEPAVYIDGNKHRDQMPMPPLNVYIQDWNFLSVLTLEAIEVYSSSATPQQYQDPCGAILIWTRRK
jgi:hypothetical protein